MRLTCEVCGKQSTVRFHHAEELTFGLREAFDYSECGHCGSLTLQNVPASLTGYYPLEYHAPLLSRAGHADSRLLRVVRPLVTRVRLRSSRFGALTMRAGKRFGFHFEPWMVLLDGTRLGLDAAILDVGCGSGQRLQAFHRYGFRNLTGIDAYIPDDAVTGANIRFLRGTPQDLSGSFDLVMLHHSLEHMANPVSVFGALRRLVAPEGLLLIRVPLAGSFAWRTYGVEWVQLDPPRHLFLYTPAGLDALASRVGFDVTRVLYDSDAYQFWGSEQFRRGISIRGPGGVSEPEGVTFSSEQLEEFDRRARILNDAREGDQAAFLLRKAGSSAGVQ